MTAIIQVINAENIPTDKPEELKKICLLTKRDIYEHRHVYDSTIKRG